MTACFCGIGISVCEMIMPDEKFSKQINFILSLVFVISIITPFKLFADKVSDNGISYRSAGYEFSYEGEEMYDAYLEKTICHNIEESIISMLEAKNIPCEKVSVSIDISDSYCISISKAGIVSSEFEKASEMIMSEISEDCEIWDMENYE